MADRLSIYNMALGHLLEGRIRTLTENREPRRVLDDFWDQEVAYCLERHPWNFSYRAVRMDASTTVLPAFGFKYAFPIPNDWTRTRLLSAVPTLDPPLLQVREEAGYWYTDITPIYVQFNSSSPSYGMNLGNWPASFTDFVALRLARKACGRIPAKVELLQGPDGLIRQEDKACKTAAAICAMNDPIGFAPMSSWVRARRGLPGSGGDSPIGSLTG